MLALIAAPAVGFSQPPAPAVAAFDSYVCGVESRIELQHRPHGGFVVSNTVAAGNESRLRNGELIVEELTPAKNGGLRGTLIHHWRGTAFVAGAKAADFEQLMKNFDEYPRHFHPQVISAQVLRQQGDHFETRMRVRQHHVLTVVMDMSYDVRFGRPDPGHVYSYSRSTAVREIEASGTSRERTLSPGEEHGFLWRLNSYWSCAERDGGLYMQIESVSLTRDIPHGLGWIVGPFIQSIPRESLKFTLDSTRRALAGMR